MKKSRFTRLAAIVLAAATLWITAVTAGADSLRSAIAAVRDSARLPVALLRWELGDTFPVDALALPAMLALRESPLLLSAWAEVSSLPASDDAAPVSEPDTSRKEPEETPQPSLPDAPRDDADNGAASQTIAPTSPSGFVQVGDVFIKNNSTKALDPAWFDGSFAAALSDDAPQVLIVHTHGSEAYTQDEQDVYVESDPYRTTDCTKNVVRVGEEMAQVFRSQGFEVVHDTTLYDYPAYNGAYERSCAGVEKWLEQYPTIKLVLDVHRDALVSADGAAYKLVSEVEGQKVAQVMLVVGSNDSGMEHPNWRENLALAVKLQLELTRDWGQLARPITLRSSRYNQHLSPGSLLVEVGGHGNTLQEAIAGARLFAQSIGQVLKTMEEP